MQVTELFSKELVSLVNFTIITHNSYVTFHVKGNEKKRPIL